jgi:N-methylhydantoinase A
VTLSKSTDNALQIGVDIGGTFTDVVSRDRHGRLRYFKIPTTRSDESIAVLESIKRLTADWEMGPETIERFAHGTTVATNAVLERKGTLVGLITTDGFRDVLEIGRQMRQSMYSIILSPATPVFLIPRNLRKEVPERVGFDGEILTPLDEAALMRSVEELIAEGVKAIAVCFLFSIVNPIHERRARDIIKSAYPNLTLSISHEVDPAFREYERTVVTAFDAYVKPAIDQYLSRIETGLKNSGVQVPLQVMQSRGGLTISTIARRRAVRLLLSGPAAGVVGAQISGVTAGIANLITVDIGGTSSDIALIRNGRALIRSEGIIDGYPIRVPMVDVNSIGSGGGSIAQVDATGTLKLGPKSAGSEPGPVCFGRGGSQPTVTDASIVLGYLNPDNFAGGSVRLWPELAKQVIEKTIAEPLGLTTSEAALGIHRIVNAQMAEGIRAISTNRGIDPRNFALMPLGGGGAIHATALAADLGMSKVVIPLYPGVLAAAGLLLAPIEHEMSVAFGKTLRGLDAAEVTNVLHELDAGCNELMSAESLGGASVNIRYFADVCYIGQAYWLEIPLVTTEPEMLAKLYEDFLEAHRNVYGHAHATAARIANLRSVHRAGGSDRIDAAPYSDNGESPISGERSILVNEKQGVVSALIYNRNALPVGYEFDGPAIVEQPDTTILVSSGWRAHVIDSGILILDRQQNDFAGAANE